MEGGLKRAGCKKGSTQAFREVQDLEEAWAQPLPDPSFGHNHYLRVPQSFDIGYTPNRFTSESLSPCPHVQKPS